MGHDVVVLLDFCWFNWTYAVRFVWLLLLIDIDMLGPCCMLWSENKKSCWSVRLYIFSTRRQYRVCWVCCFDLYV